ERLPPSAHREPSAEYIAETGEHIKGLNNEDAALNHRQSADASSREVEVQRPHDVDTGIILEHPEIRADPRIEIEQQVFTGAFVEPVIYIDNASVANAG